MFLKKRRVEKGCPGPAGLAGGDDLDRHAGDLLDHLGDGLPLLSSFTVIRGQDGHAAPFDRRIDDKGMGKHGRIGAGPFGMGVHGGKVDKEDGKRWAAEGRLAHDFRVESQILHMVSHVFTVQNAMNEQPGQDEMADAVLFLGTKQCRRAASPLGVGPNSPCRTSPAPVGPPEQAPIAPGPATRSARPPAQSEHRPHAAEDPGSPVQGSAGPCKSELAQPPCFSLGFAETSERLQIPHLPVHEFEAGEALTAPSIVTQVPVQVSATC